MHAITRRPTVFWEHRTYPGDLSRLSRARADLAGFDPDLGTHVWAEFAMDPGAAPENPRPYVFTR